MPSADGALHLLVVRDVCAPHAPSSPSSSSSTRARNVMRVAREYAPVRRECAASGRRALCSALSHCSERVRAREATRALTAALASIRSTSVTRCVRGEKERHACAATLGRSHSTLFARATRPARGVRLVVAAALGALALCRGVAVA